MKYQILALQRAGGGSIVAILAGASINGVANSSARLSNLDERVFPDALTVNFDRKRVPYATRGNGIHFCPGATLARTELRIFADTWLQRVPEFHLKPGVEVSYRGGHNVMLREFHLALGPQPNGV